MKRWVVVTIAVMLGSGVALAQEAQPGNLAAAANGGQIVRATSEGTPDWAAANLLDGIIGKRGWSSELNTGVPPQEVVIDLAGEMPVTIDRVVVSLDTGPEVLYGPYWAKDVDILVSSTTADDAAFRLAGQITLARTEEKQTITLQPVSAKFLKLRVNSAQGGSPDTPINRVEVAELEVYGAGAAPLPAGGGMTPIVPTVPGGALTGPPTPGQNLGGTIGAGPAIPGQVVPVGPAGIGAPAGPVAVPPVTAGGEGPPPAVGPAGAGVPAQPYTLTPPVAVGPPGESTINITPDAVALGTPTTVPPTGPVGVTPGIGGTAAVPGVVGAGMGAPVAPPVTTPGVVGAGMGAPVAPPVTTPGVVGAGIGAPVAPPVTTPGVVETRIGAPVAPPPVTTPGVVGAGMGAPVAPPVTTPGVVGAGIGAPVAPPVTTPGVVDRSASRSSGDHARCCRGGYGSASCSSGDDARCCRPRSRSACGSGGPARRPANA